MSATIVEELIECKSCHECLPRSCYNKQPTNKNGLTGKCKSCISIAGKKYREEHPDNQKAYHAKWYQDNKDKVKESSKKWIEDNYEYHKEYSRIYYQNNKEKQLRYVREHREANPEIYRESHQRRRAKQLGNRVEPYSRKDIFERDECICKLCGELVDIDTEWIHQGDAGDNAMYPTIDHIVPVSKGGADAPDNVQLAHLRCNVLKGHKI